ncbi:DUF6436 domain-containing protein [Ectopseudomonas khazarica]|uniref:DUF6436 domain-containing protein n=1 Tax=Ectopseudomonas khazarica TaxID=2502979 RepID=UPI001EFB076B|nr:DUF6436 domain-containing protein [Pseudomonas sp. NFPP33]
MSTFHPARQWRSGIAIGAWLNFGPNSEGASRIASNSFIEHVLEALIAGRRVSAGNNMALGCFCSWRS